MGTTHRAQEVIPVMARRRKKEEERRKRTRRRVLGRKRNPRTRGKRVPQRHKHLRALRGAVTKRKGRTESPRSGLKGSLVTSNNRGGIEVTALVATSLERMINHPMWCGTAPIPSRPVATSPR